jgi:hypothetical protein
MTPDPDFEARIRRQLHRELSDLTPIVDGGIVRQRLAERPGRSPRNRGLTVGTPNWATRLMVAVTVATVVIGGTLTGAAVTGLLRSNPPPPAPAGQAVSTPSPSTLPTEQPTPVATPARPRPSCAVTLPDPAFAAPSPYPSQPFGGRRLWYGSDGLWTMLDPHGEVWSGLPRSSGGLTQKTFWFSTDMSPTQITVSGIRLDDSGAFTSAPGTNATSADFGDAMLVGIEVPTPGCWQITGHYRGAELSYVVLVNGQ